MTSTTTVSTTEPEVVVTAANGLGRIELNRPKAINALNTNMVAIIASALENWRDDDEVQAVLITGRGERGLCAGGDIKAIYQDLLEATGASIEFWRDEYAMNLAISQYPKPYIAIMNGITMGGGVGVSVHGSVRIVTDSSQIGMPETGIGLFPDVGGTWYLARMPQQIGVYLGLTGLAMGPGAAIAHGWADHFVPEAKLADLIAELEQRPADAKLVVDQFAQEPPADEFAADVEWIADAFAHDSVEEILAALDARPEERAQATLALLGTKSPTSLKFTLAAIRAAAQQTLAETLDQDYRLAVALTKRPDLKEGIRAQVIDKDRNPQWDPASISGVADADVAAALGGSNSQGE